MKNSLLILSFLLILSRPFAQKIIMYEYWLDEDVTAKVTTSITPVKTFHLQQDFSLAQASYGMHIFNIRFRDSTNMWSSIIREFFIKSPPSGSINRQIIGYEYWFDDNYAAKIYTPVLSGSIFQLSDSLLMNSVTFGFHTISFRFKDDLGKWSSIVSQFFTKFNAPRIIPNSITHFKFWYDNDLTTLETIHPEQPLKYYNWSDTVETPFLSIGNHTINYQFTDSNKCLSSIRTDTFAVISCLPHGGRQIIGPANICVGNTGVVYSIRKIKNANSYTWSLPTGASITTGNNTNAITVDFSQTATSGNISVFASNPCGSGEVMTLPVIVHQPVNPTVLGGNSACLGTPGWNYSTESGMTDYRWGISFGGTIIGNSTGNSIDVVWNSSGSQFVHVKYTNPNGCIINDSTQLNITVNLIPVPTLTGNQQICEGATGNNYTTEAGMFNYQWEVVGGIIIAGGENEDHTATINWYSSESSSVSISYSDEIGCMSAAPTTINVVSVSLPYTANEITGPAQVVQGQVGTSYFIDPISNATGYSWQLPTGTSIVSGNNTNSVTVNFSNSALPGIINVKGINNCGDGGPSPNLFINVIPLIQNIQNQTIVAGQMVCYGAAQTINVAGNGTTYTISPGSSSTFIAGENIVYKPDCRVYFGGYMSGVITTNGQYCFTQQPSMISSLSDDVDAIPKQEDSSLKVYPNPTQRIFTIEINNSDPIDIIDVELFNLHGKKIMKESYYQENRHDFSLINAPNGIYIIKVVYGDRIETRKIIKQ
jgi:hypothetical protein